MASLQSHPVCRRFCAFVSVRMLLAFPAIVSMAASQETYSEDGFPKPPRMGFAPGILSEAECDELIAMADANGWNMHPDSIDDFKAASQDIYILDRGEVMNEKLWAWVHQRLPRISEFVRLHSWDPDEFVPSADWIYLRKYSAEPGSQRKSLKGHRDTNQYSVNIPLNHDFEGGQIWFLRPSFEHEHDNWLVPRVQPRTNTTSYFFPPIQGGTAMVHDNTVSHGISSVTKGSKYTFILFYNVPEDDPLQGVDVYIFDKRSRSKEDLKLVWVGPDGWVDVEPGFGALHHTYIGHRFAAVRQADDLVVKEWVIEKDVVEYSVHHDDDMVAVQTEEL